MKWYVVPSHSGISEGVTCSVSFPALLCVEGKSTVLSQQTTV